MNPRPTVWVVKEQVRAGQYGSTPMDYTAAYEFGDVKFITDMDMPLHHDSPLREAWLDKMFAFLNEFDERDFIVLTGSPLAIFVTGLTMGMTRIRTRPLQILVWRREQGRYVRTTI